MENTSKLTTAEIIEKLTERQELQRIIDEATAAMDAITAEIKEHMAAEGVDELNAGPFRATWKYSKPRTVADVEKMKAAGIFDAFSKEQAPARPFRVF